MAIILVPTNFATIELAVAAAASGDTIQVEASYAGFENVSVNVNNLTFDGQTAQTNITLTLAAGVTDISATGVTPFIFSGNDGSNAIIGNDGDNVITVGSGVDTVDGGAGNDSLNTGTGAAVVDGGAGLDFWSADFTDDATAKIIDLNLTGVQAAGYGTSYVNIERMRILGGAGNDVLTSLTGSSSLALDDLLYGGLGNDTITVGGGIDDVDGGVGGDDLLIIDYAASASSFSSLFGGALISGGPGTQVFISSIERITATFGSGDDNIAFAGHISATFVATGALDGNDRYTGGFNIDTLDYSALAGGLGISLTLSSGFTNVNVRSGDIDVVSGIENVTGTQDGDDVTGNFQDNVLRGEGGVDTLSGADGADVIDGGALEDNCFGGAGNDTFKITGSELGDNVYGGEDIDVLDLRGWTNSAVAFDINLSTEIYQHLPNASGVNGIYAVQDVENVRGSNFSDTITGTSGDNILVGGGGADTMAGSFGNDSFYVDNALDTVLELTGNGQGTIDTIFTSVSFASALNVERMYLTGTRNINGTGVNGQNDIMYGNSGNNMLDGLTGADNMNGGLGNDSYHVENTGDLVHEAAGAGTDTIFAQTTYTLALNVERLYLLNGGNYNANGRNGQNDFIAGNSGDNVINSFSGNDIIRGGFGNDTLTGGLGLDIFQFLTNPNATFNRDTITDFTAVDDTMHLDNLFMTQLGPNGALAAGAFNTGAAASQADNRVIYNTTTGALFYDPDGSGALAAIQFAALTGAPVISAADFIVV